jgi:hypothetical protein
MRLTTPHAATAIGRTHWHDLAGALRRDFSDAEVDTLESAITRRARRCRSMLR